MARWGIAFANGINYNRYGHTVLDLEMQPEPAEGSPIFTRKVCCAECSGDIMLSAKQAFHEINVAIKDMSHLTEVERALIREFLKQASFINIEALNRSHYHLQARWPSGTYGLSQMTNTPLTSSSDSSTSSSPMRCDR